MKSGFFITFEGGEGSGKSYQKSLLAEYLRGQRYNVLETREPGGTEIGEIVRNLLLDPKYSGILTVGCEVTLYSASRAQIVGEVINPALEEGKIVIADRFYDSSFAYQGEARGLNVDDIKAMTRLVTEGLTPDITFLLDIDPKLGFSRIGRTLDRLEREGRRFHEKVREGYLEIARSEPERVVLIDGSQKPEPITEQIKEEITNRLSSLDRFLIKN